MGRPERVVTPRAYAPAHLDHVDQLVVRIVEEAVTPAQALAVLRSRGYNPDPEALNDAVCLWHDLHDLLDGSKDPSSVFDAPPRAGVNMLDAAISKVAGDYAWRIGTLARRASTTGTRDRYAQCDDTCTTDCGACKGQGRPS